MQAEPFLFSTQKSRRGRKFSKTHLGLICLITQNLLGRDNFSSLVSLAINFSSEGGFLFAPQKKRNLVDWNFSGFWITEKNPYTYR